MPTTQLSADRLGWCRSMPRRRSRRASGSQLSSGWRQAFERCSRGMERYDFDGEFGYRHSRQHLHPGDRADHRTGLRQSIYYARNIAAGSNTVTVTFNQAATFVDVRILEYSGLDTSNPLDVTAGAIGNSATASSGNALTTKTNELIFGAGMTSRHYTTAGTGYCLGSSLPRMAT